MGINRDCNNRIIKEYDVVRVLVPVSGKSVVEEKEVSFPAGTEGTVIDLYNSGCVVEICWNTSDASNDGILVEDVSSCQLEVVWREGEKIQ